MSATSATRRDSAERARKALSPEIAQKNGAAESEKWALIGQRDMKLRDKVVGGDM